MTPHFHKHIRLPGRDYTQGAYFVTLCTRERVNIFGHIIDTGSNAVMQLNDVGCIVDECWNAIPDHFPRARLDQTQVMPDHLHAILVLAPVGSTQWVDATVRYALTMLRPMLTYLKPFARMVSRS